MNIVKINTVEIMVFLIEINSLKDLIVGQNDEGKLSIFINNHEKATCKEGNQVVDFLQT